MNTSELTTICVLMAMSLAALISIWLIGATSYVGLVHPERVISKEILEMAKTAETIISNMITGLVVAAVLRQQPSPPTTK